MMLFFPGLASSQSVAQGEPREIVDGLGRTVRVEHAAQRVIALYGGFNEILDAMGIAQRIIARTSNETFPPSILNKPGIGTHMRPNLELITGLAPDLVLQLAGRKTAADTVRQLEERGIHVAAFHPSSFEELFDAIQKIGVLTGEEIAASRLVAEMNGRLSAVKSQLGTVQHRPSVFFEIRSPNLLCAGQGGIVNDVINRAGGRNCVQSERKIVRMGEEALVGLNPEVYVVQRGPMNTRPQPLEERSLYRTLRAVQDGRVLLVDERLFSRPGPRLVEAVEQLARFLYPEKMRKNRIKE